jgi:hypothetical protein
MQAMDCGGGGGRNKGLRHFALLVCNKIETKGRTTYNEVADELAEELKAEADAGGEESDKNIRRRVYDAFNVLLAVGIIAKEGKKEIVWKGFPGPKVRNVDDLKRERQRRVQAVEQKQQELKVREGGGIAHGVHRMHTCRDVLRPCMHTACRSSSSNTAW